MERSSPPFGGDNNPTELAYGVEGCKIYLLSLPCSVKIKNSTIST